MHKIVIGVLFYLLCVNVSKALECYTCYHPLDTNNTCYHVQDIDNETCKTGLNKCIKLRRANYITSRSCSLPCTEFIKTKRQFRCYECDYDLCNSVGTRGFSWLMLLALNFVTLAKEKLKDLV
ncbi:uncharacterized protein LOC126265578 [Aethina tumida]|uniref:uncharacterized protein LOC126265578 n=1 Tax=Aethina tumida TaxID=116153 RepID=UPI002148B970|nr:uncharacterized protein LOC126265578 [Aethina tumida]